MPEGTDPAAIAVFILAMLIIGGVILAQYIDKDDDKHGR